MVRMYVVVTNVQASQSEQHDVAGSHDNALYIITDEKSDDGGDEEVTKKKKTKHKKEIPPFPYPPTCPLNKGKL